MPRVAGGNIAEGFQNMHDLMGKAIRTKSPSTIIAVSVTPFVRQVIPHYGDPIATELKKTFELIGPFRYRLIVGCTQVADAKTKEYPNASFVRLDQEFR